MLNWCKLATCFTVFSFIARWTKCVTFCERVYIHTMHLARCYCRSCCMRTRILSVRYLDTLLFVLLLLLEFYYFCYFSPVLLMEYTAFFMPHNFFISRMFRKEIVWKESCFLSSNWNCTREIVKRIPFMCAIWLRIVAVFLVLYRLVNKH